MHGNMAALQACQHVVFLSFIHKRRRKKNKHVDVLCSCFWSPRPSKEVWLPPVEPKENETNQRRPRLVGRDVVRVGDRDHAACTVGGVGVRETPGQPWHYRAGGLAVGVFAEVGFTEEPWAAFSSAGCEGHALQYWGRRRVRKHMSHLRHWHFRDGGDYNIYIYIYFMRLW